MDNQIVTLPTVVRYFCRRPSSSLASVIVARYYHHRLSLSPLSVIITAVPVVYWCLSEVWIFQLGVCEMISFPFKNWPAFRLHCHVACFRKGSR